MNCVFITRMLLYNICFYLTMVTSQITTSYIDLMLQTKRQNTGVAKKRKTTYALYDVKMSHYKQPIESGEQLIL